MWLLLLQFIDRNNRAGGEQAIETRKLCFADNAVFRLTAALPVGQRLLPQSGQLAGWNGARAMIGASASPRVLSALSCWANCCGAEMEVWTEAEAQRPK